MSEPPLPAPVDPEQLLQACLIITDVQGPEESGEPMRLSMAAAMELLDRIGHRLGVAPWGALDLFRRSCAIANFLAVASNRTVAGIDDEKLPPTVWTAAARAPVHQAVVGGLACDTFDPREFAAALKRSAE